MGIVEVLALDKVVNLFRILQQNGGIRNSLYTLYRTSELKDGNLVGEDEYGNKYYENPRYFFARSRWIIYAPRYKEEYDASQIPAEWYGWMHYKTDLLPSQDCARPKYSWMAKHTEHLTGTTGQYVPYTTTPPKIEAWDPSTVKQ